MKKFLCIVLTLVLIFSLTACRSQTEQAAEAIPETSVAAESLETEAVETASAETVPATLAETIEESFVFDAEASLAENSKTVTYKTPKEYQEALHKMGFKEYRGDLIRQTMNSGVACKPISLTYNDQVFRMDFDYLDFADANDLNKLVAELKTVPGWSLYGMKNAPEAGNLSSYHPGDYEQTDFMDYAEADAEFSSDFASIQDYWMYDGSNAVTCLSQYYYPDTGNLYNLVNVFDKSAASVSVPRILTLTEEELTMKDNGFVEVMDYGFEIKEGVDLRWAQIRYVDKDSDMIVGFYYEAGMTMAEWATSQYAHGSPWVVALSGKALTYPHSHEDIIESQCFIENADRPIEEILLYDDDGVTPYILAPLVTTAQNFVAVEDPKSIAVITFQFDTGDQSYMFTPGMTLIDWVNSDYNKIGWTVVDETTVQTPDGTGYIKNADKDIMKLGKVSTYPMTMVTVKITYD